MSFKQLPFYILILALASCGKKNTSEGENTFAKHSNQKQIFQKLDNNSIGVDFQNKLIENNQVNSFNFGYLYNGGAVALGDINNDKLVDVYLVSINGANKLFLNKGNMKFEEITQTAGVAAAEGTKMGVTLVDVNNDGYLDIYQCRSGIDPKQWNDLLFINQKDNTFKESAVATGFNDNAPTNAANFFDYDNDGDLDMYLLNHPVDFETVNNVRVKQVGDRIEKVQIPDLAFESDKMYKNNGNGTFTEVTVQAGIVNRAFGLSSAISDFNGDGYLDMYVCNDYAEPDYLYINNKNGSFTNKIDDYIAHFTNNSMGSDLADINNDGLVDLLSLDMLPEDNFRQKLLMTSMRKDRYNTLVKYAYGKQLMRNMLHLNTGKGFSEIACLSGISATDWSWSPLIEDFDNDGWKDISITNGYFHDVNNMDYMNFTLDSLRILYNGDLAKMDIAGLEKLIPRAKLRNYIYRNNGDLTFEDVSDAWGFTEKTFSNGSAYADLDNDGDMDLVINNILDQASFYENKARQELASNNYLQINFEGFGKNTKAVGSKVRLLYEGKQQYEELTPSRGFLSSSEHLLHFGVGAAQKIDEIQVTWADGKITQLTNVPTNQRLTLKYSDAKVGKFPKAVTETPIFAAANNLGIDFKHQENTFDDFDREYLLPRKLSTLGPCLSTADVNGDGLEDFYIGGATGNSGCLYVQNANSTFSKGSVNTWETDKNYEDTGSLFFDADGDKDMDLYVVSGDNANIAGAAIYQDRLYVNDGKGNFTKNTGALPTMTSSKKAIASIDFDKDGDLDLFVGARSNPGRYPSAPISFVLQNNGGKFTDVTNSIALEFQALGMISDLAVADMDKDGSAEVIAVGEWMPITIFKYDGSKFKNATANFGLENTTGWWNCLKISDLDNDGDVDIVAGNFGYNSRFQANATQPMQIFYKDFDNNGSAEPILAWYKQGKCYPVSVRDEFVKQMPSFKKKYLHYRDYANATIDDIFGSDLKSALHLDAKTLATTYFENNGNGKFTSHELALEAQVSPVFDITIQDFNGDSIKDIVLVGNTTAEWVETGPIEASYGVLLAGDGKGGFVPKRNLNTGFWANKEARKIAAITLANKKQLYIVANNNDVVQTFIK